MSWWGSNVVAAPRWTRPGGHGEILGADLDGFYKEFEGGLSMKHGDFKGVNYQK